MFLKITNLFTMVCYANHFREIMSLFNIPYENNRINMYKLEQITIIYINKMFGVGSENGKLPFNFCLLHLV